MVNRTNCVKNRIGTLRYEISKSIIPKPEELSIEEKQIRARLLELENGKCIYCKGECGNGVGDHFHPMVRNMEPGEYCNDDWNVVPCCVRCNSSKGGKHWKEWLTSNHTARSPISKMSNFEISELYNRLSQYDEEMQKHCQKRDVIKDKSFFKTQMEKIVQVLKDVQENCDNYVAGRDSNLQVTMSKVLEEIRNKL